MIGVDLFWFCGLVGDLFWFMLEMVDFMFGICIIRCMVFIFMWIDFFSEMFGVWLMFGIIEFFFILGMNVVFRNGISVLVVRNIVIVMIMVLWLLFRFSFSKCRYGFFILWISYVLCVLCLVCGLLLCLLLMCLCVLGLSRYDDSMGVSVSDSISEKNSVIVIVKVSGVNILFFMFFSVISGRNIRMMMFMLKIMGVVIFVIVCRMMWVWFLFGLCGLVRCVKVFFIMIMELLIIKLMVMVNLFNDIKLVEMLSLFIVMNVSNGVRISVLIMMSDECMLFRNSSSMIIISIMFLVSILMMVCRVELISFECL